MAEGFWEGWGRYLFNSYSFVFTVLGAIVALVIAREYWWVSVLIVVAAFAASGFFAYHRHRELRQEKERHRVEVERLQDEHRTTAQQLREAERKLSEVPLDVLAQLERVIASYSFDVLARLLIRHAEFVGRMQSFARASAKPLNLRTFTKQAGSLYAVAKGAPETLEHLRTGDPFLLMHVGTEGLETRGAQLVVHQPPQPGKGVVMFRIVAPLSDDVGHIERLAESRDVEGMKGYRLAPACNVESYPDANLGTVSDFIHRLVSDFAQQERR